MVDERTSEASAVPSEAELEERWAAVDADPDLEEDLGYEAMDLDVLVTSSSEPKVMLLPADQAELRDDAYVVADMAFAEDPVERA